MKLVAYIDKENKILPISRIIFGENKEPISVMFMRYGDNWNDGNYTSAFTLIESTRLVDAAKLYSKKNENSNWRVIIDNYEKLHKGGVDFRWLDCANRAGPQDIRYQAKIHRLFSDGPDSLINNVSYNNKMQERYNRLLV